MRAVLYLTASSNVVFNVNDQWREDIAPPNTLHFYDSLFRHLVQTEFEQLGANKGKVNKWFLIGIRKAANDLDDFGDLVQLISRFALRHQSLPFSFETLRQAARRAPIKAIPPNRP